MPIHRVVAIAIAWLVSACHGPRTTEVETGWLRIEREEPDQILPHAVGVGEKASRVLVKRSGQWRVVRRLTATDTPVAYGAGFALVPAVDDAVGRFLLAVRADGATAELPHCAALTADDDGLSASCVRCAGACDTIEITTYRDPLAPPSVRSLDRPRDACASGVASTNGQGDVAWARAQPGDAPGIRIQCSAPTACVYLRVDPDALVAWGQRSEPCP
jgi:hypothetical protein